MGNNASIYPRLRMKVAERLRHRSRALCAPLDWQYAELPSSASDAVLRTVLVVRCGTSNQICKIK